ncbi:MAG: YiiX family permuted papain-like enzyme [Candidatus Accumulibacter sp.]|jgi:hypothetical protein|nr:YiiX family permuted papain-like enzyme [Accumulibacter sp.]
MQTFAIRKAAVSLFLLLLIVAMAAACPAYARASGEIADFREGDVIFQTSVSPQSQAIQLATHSLYSHCGVIFRIGKAFYVYEAVRTVRFTPLRAWIARGKEGRYVVRRLKDADRLLTPAAIGKLRSEGKKFEGKPYDLVFSWSDDRIYCSELIYKLFRRALGLETGKIQRLRDFDLKHPAVRQKLQERYGDRIPLDERVVSPQAIFESDLFVTVD